MLFNTMTFMVFLVAVLALYAGARSHAQRAGVLLVASFLFYASWKPAYLLLLVASLTVNYWFYSALTRHRSKALVVTAVTLNLIVLAISKYIVFLTDNFIFVWTAVSGQQAAVPEWMHWALPLGISFYTFHMLSVMIDVYRGQWTERISFRTWTLYVTFFPHMVAGPILRASELVAQLEQLAPIDRDNLRLGALIFLGGLLKKVLLADQLAPLADMAFAHPTGLTTTMAWIGSATFSLQMYFDFSGYSEMAIGLARMFGVNLPRNFLYPYVSRNPREFWQRWHMTFSRWLRDYLYISLGGNRVGFSRGLVNLMLTMLIGGLWHGAAWTFVFWGFLNGLFLVGHRFLLWIYRQLGVDRMPRLSSVLSFLGWFSNFALIMVCSRVFFRAESWDDAWTMFYAVLGMPALTGDPVSYRSFQYAIIGGSLAICLLEPRIVGALAKRDLVTLWWSRPAWLRGCAYAGLVVFLTVFGGAAQKFVYFDF